MTLKNYARSVRLPQGARPKTATGESANVRVALSPSGRETFITGESLPDPRDKRRWRSVNPWSVGKVWSVCNLRLNGIQRLIVGRHHGPCRTDDGIAYFDVALPHLVGRRYVRNHDDARIASYAWAQKWTPQLAEEQGPGWFEEREQEMARKFDDWRVVLPDADRVAQDLCITAAEVAVHELKTIGAVDRRAEQRDIEAKAKRAARDRQRRIEKLGSTPRDESMTATEVWKQSGYNSRATYYRAVARGDIAPDPRMRTQKRKAKTPRLRLVHSV